VIGAAAQVLALQLAALWEQQTALAEECSPHLGFASRQAAHEHNQGQQSQHCYNCPKLNKAHKRRCSQCSLQLSWLEILLKDRIWFTSCRACNGCLHVCLGSISFGFCISLLFISHIVIVQLCEFWQELKDLLQLLSFSVGLQRNMLKEQSDLTFCLYLGMSAHGLSDSQSTRRSGKFTSHCTSASSATCRDRKCIYVLCLSLCRAHRQLLQTSLFLRYNSCNLTHWAKSLQAH